MNLENLPKLATKEDPYHIHKIIGSLCMINFFIRHALLYLYGNMFFHNSYNMSTIALHGILAISSLFIHIPALRNPAKPMIYPEYRLHSIVFSLRSVVVCFLVYNGAHVFWKMSMCYVTMIAADIVTYFYNPNNQNGSTMKNMPYDSRISSWDKSQITLMNSSLQIGATLYMLDTVDSAFSPLFGIQFAAFLMTMVRKSIISANTWYILYAFSLWISSGFYLSHFTSDFIIILVPLFYLYVEVFFSIKLNKYISWTIVFSAFTIYQMYLAELVRAMVDMYIGRGFIYIRYFLFVYFWLANLHICKALFM